MTFIARPQGTTLRRAHEALVAPHPGTDRFDPDFKISMRCSKCGKFAYGPRRYMREAMEEHMRSVCPARKTKENEPQLTRLFYPRQ